jgi:type I restriction enzyme M protein
VKYLKEKELIKLYKQAHNYMRNIDGLQPQEAFDELIKILFLKIQNEKNNYKYINDVYIESKELLILYITPIIKNNNWFNSDILLSRETFDKIYTLIKDIQFSKLEKDIKSSALRHFLTPEIRKGLGIFLTPDDIVKSIVEISKPKYGEKILDLTCGSGTFLIEAVNYIKKKENPPLPITVYGTDKSPRMFLLAELNLVSEDINFIGKVQDSLLKDNDIISENTYDLIITNPPFGVKLENDIYDFNNYATCKNDKSVLKSYQNSEIVFLEQSLKYLKEGGRIGIVLPKSIINNVSLSFQREEINKLGYLEKIMSLPSETFQITGTQTNTFVLFMRKFKKEENKKELINIEYIDIKNVGYDSTGRAIDKNDLLNILNIQNTFIEKIEKINSLSLVNDFISKNESSLNYKKILKDVSLEVNTGKTPARKEYSESGSFLVKVGNLTGNGINWKPRDRNFIDKNFMEKRKKSSSCLMIQKYDILLTSSAHNPKYIGEKVDMIYNIPEFISEDISFVGEVMLIRLDINKINPFMLYAYLKTDEAKKYMRDSIRGQTAHLSPADLLKMPIPDYLFEENQEIINILTEELELNYKLNCLNFKKEELLNKLK